MQFTFADVNLIRNGDMAQGNSAWATNSFGTHVGAGYGPDGPGMQIWTEDPNAYGFAYQTLYLPTRTTAATLSFDYRFLPGYGAVWGWFWARIATPDRSLAAPLQLTVYPGESWQSARVTLGADELAALNAAHAAGDVVYLILELYAQFLQVNVSNVVLRVSGHVERPDLEGCIAYIGLDEDGQATTIGRLDPDGGRRQTLWSLPEAIAGLSTITDVAWRPDARELAFSSDHDSLRSAFHSDVYGLPLAAPKNTTEPPLRRITNPPSQTELTALREGGGYPTCTVRGKILNDYGPVALFSVYVEGTEEVVSVDVGEYGDVATFVVPNVAILEDGSLPYVVFAWSSLYCAYGKEYASAVAPLLPGRVVDVGTLAFQGNCGEYRCSAISWRGDGSQIGVQVLTPRVFQAGGEAVGRELFDAPLTAREMAWSPVDDRILYRNQTFDQATGGLYLTTVGGDAGRRLVADEGAVWVSMVWLPDGSGFVYALDNALYHYDLGCGQSVRLAEFHNEYITHPSVSPDGQYIVFERQTMGLPLRYDLWIVNRARPTEMWPLTDDGRSANPDWSRAAPP